MIFLLVNVPVYQTCKMLVTIKETSFSAGISGNQVIWNCYWKCMLTTKSADWFSLWNVTRLVGISWKGMQPVFSVNEVNWNALNLQEFHFHYIEKFRRVKKVCLLRRTFLFYSMLWGLAETFFLLSLSFPCVEKQQRRQEKCRFNLNVAR